MDKGISFEVIWMDDDLVEVRVRAGNGRFSGVADCYGGHDVFLRLADVLRSFPSAADDHREAVLGTFDPGYAAGDGARLVLRCADKAGHVVADVTIQAEELSGTGHREGVQLSLPLEPAALDGFIATLGKTPLVVGAAAYLRQAT
jgi:hypothetical protein